MYTIAALIQTYPSFSEMIVFSLMGFGVVLVVLVSLSMMTSIVGAFFIFADKKPAEQKSAPVASKPADKKIPQDHEFVISAAVAAVMPELQNEKGELLAVLTAAAVAVLEEETRVISFKEIAPDMSYARQGRQQIYASKNYIPTRF